MRNELTNIYYAPIFKFDIDNVKMEYKSVGIDLRYRKYILEINKSVERSFVSWCESEYKDITRDEMLTYLEEAYRQGQIDTDRYQELQSAEEAKLSFIPHIEKVYKKIAEDSIYASRRKPIINPKIDSAETLVYNNRYYVNYRYKENKSFTKFYLNRYSLNQGWCVRINKNETGYKLIVIYSRDRLPDLFENNTMNNFLSKYYSDTETYYSMDVKEKQLTLWEFNYVLNLLEENDIYTKLKPNMDIDKEKTIGCTGPCSFKILYDDIFIEGEAAIDDKSCCGVDFYGIIQKLNNL